MKPLEALQILQRISSVYKGTAQEHETIAHAVKTLSALLQTQEKEGVENTNNKKKK